MYTGASVLSRSVCGIHYVSHDERRHKRTVGGIESLAGIATRCCATNRLLVRIR